MHSREQYSDSFAPEPIARSAGTQVPHAAQRINLFSVLIFLLRFAGPEVPSRVPFIKLDILRQSSR